MISFSEDVQVDIVELEKINALHLPHSRHNSFTTNTVSVQNSSSRPWPPRRVLQIRWLKPPTMACVGETRRAEVLRNNMKCSECILSYPYDYFGRRPPFAPDFTFLEESFLIKDPFSDLMANSVLCVGGVCGLCEQIVCSSQRCSLFYSVRICGKCVRGNIDNVKEKLPRELGSQVEALIETARR